MITQEEDERLNRITARLGEHFGDYVVIVRPGKGGSSWRSTNPNWAESVAREYISYFEMGQRLQQMDDFHRRDR